MSNYLDLVKRRESCRNFDPNRPVEKEKLALCAEAASLRDAGHGLLPPRCLVCREPAGSGLDLCAACATALPRLHHACPRCALPLPETIECGQCLQTPPPLTRTHAVFVYGFPLDRLIPRSFAPKLRFLRHSFAQLSVLKSHQNRAARLIEGSPSAWG